MSAKNSCKECDGVILSGSPDDLCTRCLLGLALALEQQAGDAPAPTAEDQGRAPGDSVAAGSVEPPAPALGPNQAEVVELALTEQSGNRIGRYKLLEKIGEGGFGLVYVAEQREPVKRRVALKIIKLGMDTRQVVARFEAERQTLALMDHPNIAKVFDAGATETGRPYFVMELVKGIPITKFCEQEKTETTERLKLFIQICHAVQHAHQKGIIHRDLKPSNILVTLHDGVPVPKVIDFGIAKATQAELTEKTVYTQFHQFIGTPAYMSPEQAEMSGLDIDTRSDIYSLGVLLYELLTGNTPFDTKELLKSGLDEMRKIIRERQPVRPSTRLRQTSALRAQPGQLVTPHPSLATDLDWIVMKCLEKDRVRRYEAAVGLAMDVQRYLDNEPVAARPPSAAYRLRKFIRRNKVAVTAGAAVAAALVLGICATTWQAIRATTARRQSEANAYAADIYGAQQFLLADDLGEARTLLGGYRPGSGLEHLRGFEWRCLAAEARSDYAAIDTSSAVCVLRLVLSPDGRLLAVGRSFGNIELWDAASLKRIATLETNVAYSGGVAFSPTGGLLAASRPRGGIRLWQLDPPRVIEELVCTNAPTRLSFSPDGQHLAFYDFGRLSGSIGVWDLESRHTLRHCWRYFDSNAQEAGGPICFSPDGRHLATGDDAGRIRILDWAGDRIEVDIPAHNQMVTALAYSPDGRLLASGGGYSPEDIRLWNPATGQPAGSLAGHHAWISVLQFSGDGRRLLSASGDQTIAVWNVSARRLIRRLRGHLDEVHGLVVDERRTNLISGAKDGTLARWEIDKVGEHALRFDLPGEFRQPAYAGSDASVAVLDQHGAVALWCPDQRQPPSVIAALGTNNAVMATAPGRGLLACTSPGGPVRVWSLQSANLVANLGGPPGPVDGLRFSQGEGFLLAHNTSGLVTSWEQSVGGEGVAAGGAHNKSGLVTIWEAKNWTKRSSFTETYGAYNAAALSADGRLLVMGSESGGLAWWDAVRGRRLAETNFHHAGVEGLDFSPNGTTLASTSSDGRVALWDTKTRGLIAHWRATHLGAHSLAFSPDGARLLTGLSGGEAARLWDLRTRRELLTLTAPGGMFTCATFSPDGNGLVCGSSDGHCYLWRVPSFAELDAGW